MTNDELDKALNSARETYRVPPEPPLETMWTAIDEQLMSSPSRWSLPRRGSSWSLIGLAAAAALVMGIGVGRWTAAPISLPVNTVDVATTGSGPTSARLVSDEMAAPLQRTATHYLGETEALLRELEQGTQGRYGQQATALLATTRLLLDSPAATDARMRGLFEDLELILAQIATLRSSGSPQRREQELNMIRSALTERDVVPRVRTAVVTLSSSED
ncbi:MAG TPA: hypothetical protein VJR92_06945 [Gemmatimonadaceae bacterium]|nr:hypothetical protein [Gemmatimonadaceae bacterium]